MDNKLCLSLLMDKGSTIGVQKFIETIEEWFASLHMEPDLMGLKVPGFSPKPTSYGKAKANLSRINLEHAENGSIMKMISDHKKLKTENRLRNTSIVACFNNFIGDCFFSISESIQKMSHKEWIELAKNLHSAIPFVYGYAYVMPEKFGPHWYSGGVIFESLENPHPDPIGSEMRTKWSHAALNPMILPKNWGAPLRYFFSLSQRTIQEKKHGTDSAEVFGGV